MEANYLHSADHLLLKGNSILCFSGKYRLSTRMGSARVKGSMNGVHVTAVQVSSWYQCLLVVHLKLCCLAHLTVLLAPASHINYSIGHPAFWDHPWRWQRSRRLSPNKDGSGQAMKYKTHLYALLNYCAKGNTASENCRRLYFNQSPVAVIRNLLTIAPIGSFGYFLLFSFFFFLHK